VFTKYAKVLLLTPITGSLVLCSLGLVTCGVLLARRVPKSATTQLQSRTQPIPAPLPSAPLPQAQPVALHPATPRPRPHVHPFEPVFHASLSSDQRALLASYEGMTAKEVTRSARFRAFVDTVVPYAPFHYGIDIPLTQAIHAILNQSDEPVQMHDGRYLLLTTSTGNPRRRAILWVDLQTGATIGGIFFRPSNGEPTPTLTLFSRQVAHETVRVTQLPAAFKRDLQQWSNTAGIPLVTTRYFVNAANRKSVLTHDEDYCKPAPGQPVLAKEACEQRNVQAADIDIAAASFLGQTHYASNATMHMAAGSAQAE
jgi:hypothetical protein